METKIGPMHLLTVKGIKIFDMGTIQTCQIIFDNKYTLVATNLHSFVVIRDSEDPKCFRTFEIRKGDKIWVDTSAFSADGSYKNINKFATFKGSIQHAKHSRETREEGVN